MWRKRGIEQNHRSVYDTLKKREINKEEQFMCV